MESTTSGPDLGSVVVGIDGSESARLAALWAATEAGRRESPLRIVHAADTEGRARHGSAENTERADKAGRELLEDTAAAVLERHPGLEISTELSPGKPAPSLHRAAGPHGTIVVGNRGLGGFSSLMLGSVGLRVAAGATTPVIVVRGIGDGAESAMVLAAVRDEHDLDVARYAAREAELRKASLRLVQVWNILQSVGDVATMLDGVGEIADEQVHHLTAVGDRIREEFPGLTVHTEAEKSVSVAGVLVEASHHADLLVMGGRGSPPGYIGPTLGRATHSLVHHAHCPVLLVPRHDREQGRAS